MRRRKVFDDNGNFILFEGKMKELDKLSRNFISEICRQPVMSQEELLRNLSLYRSGDKAARDRILLGKMRLVVYTIKNCYEDLDNLEFLDLLHEGFIGLKNALDKYEPSKNDFDVFANVCILRHINLAIDKYERLIKMPEHICIKRRQYDKLCEEYAMKRKDIPSDEILKEIFCVNDDSLRGIKMDDDSFISLDEMALDECSALSLSDDKCFKEIIYDVNDRQLLMVLKENLPALHYYIIWNKYLVDKKVPNGKIGNFFGVTGESIRLKEVQALKIMKPILSIDQIRKYKYNELSNLLGEEIDKYSVLPITPEMLYKYYYLSTDVKMGLDDLYYLKYLSYVKYNDEEICKMLGLSEDYYFELLALLDRVLNREFLSSSKYQEFVSRLVSDKQFNIYDVVRDNRRVVLEIINKYNGGVKLEYNNY